jgi:DNA-binding SARP family transcriptional activator
MLEFRILGRFEVSRDGEPVEVPGQRALIALAVLLLEANHLVPAERLIDALWGEHPPPTASTALRNVVTQLRKALGSDAIETVPPGYLLRIDAAALDLARVEHLVDVSHQAKASERVGLLRDALAEFRGPALQELPYVTSMQSEIRRLDDLRLLVEEDVLDAELDAGAAAELVPRIETLAARYPHRERLRGQLMLALYRSGRQTEALQAYQDARLALAEELGLEPGPALRRLHGAILRQEAGLESLERLEVDGAPAVDHLAAVAEALLSGRLVPVLAPTLDLAPALADRFGYPHGDVVETARVSQYAATLRGYGPLHDELRSAAERGEPTPVHRFLASLPPLLRSRGLPHQLIVTPITMARSSAHSPTPARRSTSSRISRPARTVGGSATCPPPETQRRSILRATTPPSSRSRREPSWSASVGGSTRRRAESGRASSSPRTTTLIT